MRPGLLYDGSVLLNWSPLYRLPYLRSLLKTLQGPVGSAAISYRLAAIGTGLVMVGLCRFCLSGVSPGLPLALVNSGLIPRLRWYLLVPDTSSPTPSEAGCSVFRCPVLTPPSRAFGPDWDQLAELRRIEQSALEDGAYLGQQRRNNIAAAPVFFASMIYPSASVPPNEVERLEAVQLYMHLPLRHQIFQAVVGLTAGVFGVPMSIMSIVEDTQVQYPGSVGLPVPERMERIDCICSAAVYTHDTTIFRDLQHHPCPWVSPASQAQTDFEFYAGTPLLSEHDFAIGTLCVLDRETRLFPPSDQELLRRLARMAMHLLDLHRLREEQPASPIPCWAEIETHLTTTTQAFLVLADPQQQPEREQLVRQLEQRIEWIYAHTHRTGW